MWFNHVASIETKLHVYPGTMNLFSYKETLHNTKSLLKTPYSYSSNAEKKNTAIMVHQQHDRLSIKKRR
jgi:hypothetical protein